MKNIWIDQRILAQKRRTTETCKLDYFFIFLAATAKRKEKENLEEKESAGRRTLVPAFPQACGAGADSI